MCNDWHLHSNAASRAFLQMTRRTAPLPCGSGWHSPAGRMHEPLSKACTSSLTQHSYADDSSAPDKSTHWAR